MSKCNRNDEASQGLIETSQVSTLKIDDEEIMDEATDVLREKGERKERIERARQSEHIASHLEGPRDLKT